MDVGVVAGAEKKPAGLHLSLEGPEAYYLSPGREMKFTLVLENRGSTVVYVSPVPGLLGGSVMILGRPLGKEPPAWYLPEGRFALFDWTTGIYQGNPATNLFALMPGRAQRYTVPICSRFPIPDTFDALEVWAIYNARVVDEKLMSKVLRLTLKSEPLRLPIDRSPSAARSDSLDAAPFPVGTPTARARPRVEVSVSPGRVLPADTRTPWVFSVRLRNHGPESTYISPVPGQVGGRFEIWARDVVGGRTVRLYERAIRCRGCAFEDLFLFRPHTVHDYHPEVCFQAPFAGEGTLDVWAVYDMREMAQVDPRAFAERLESKPVRVKVKREVPQP